jgi:hypothetical protein
VEILICNAPKAQARFLCQSLMTTARPGEKLSRPRNNINRLKEIPAFSAAAARLICP